MPLVLHRPPVEPTQTNFAVFLEVLRSTHTFPMSSIEIPSGSQDSSSYAPPAPSDLHVRFPILRDSSAEDEDPDDYF